MSSQNRYDEYPPSDAEIPNERSTLINNNSLYNRKKQQQQQQKQRISNGNNDQQQYLDQLLTAISDRRTKLQQNASFIIILSCNALERFAFYGLVCNYVLYLNKRPLNWESYNASLVLLFMLGLCNISSFFGGWIADSRIGKFKTIALSYLIYIVGYVIFPILSISGNIRLAHTKISQ